MDSNNNRKNCCSASNVIVWRPGAASWWLSAPTFFVVTRQTLAVGLARTIGPFRFPATRDLSLRPLPNYRFDLRIQEFERHHGVEADTKIGTLAERWVPSGLDRRGTCRAFDAGDRKSSQKHPCPSRVQVADCCILNAHSYRIGAAWWAGRGISNAGLAATLEN
jgi:hypothetical protein